MNTKTAITELSARFDAFEERFDRLGNDVSTIAALFYSYIGNDARPTYVNVAGWHTSMQGWYPTDVERLVLANVRAWDGVLNLIPEYDMEGYDDEQEKSPQ